MSSLLSSKVEKKPSPSPSAATEAFVDDAASSIAGSDKNHLHFASRNASHRKFESYHIQLIAIGGTVGTALFIYMGSGLTQGGPANLLMGYAFWVSVIFAVAECQVELVTQWPTNVPVSRNAARYIDGAAGFAVAWNFWLSQVALVVFEVVAFGLVLSYWPAAARVHDAVFITITILAYTALQIWDSRWFGNAEFGFALGKVILIIGLLIFTFVAMLGGNPAHDRFGFRHWNDPGAMTTPYPQHSPTLGRFEGFLACVINACFTVAGPDYLSMTAGEARNPRKVMPRAFATTWMRLVFFFLGSAIAIGILVPYDDPNLLGAIASDAPGGAASPYVIAMQRLNIPVLPDIVNALILTSVFSAGNAFTFNASRVLEQMAMDGQAPKIFARRNRNGVPYLAVSAIIALSLLGFCQVSSSAQVVITYLTGLVGSCQLLVWVVMSYSWICWNSSMKKQGISRDTLHARSRLQPYCAWYSLISSCIVFLMQGYGVFLKGNWDTPAFIFAYFPIGFFAVLFAGWKLLKRTKWETAESRDVTSFVNDPEFTEYHDYEADGKPRGKVGAKVHKTLEKVF